MSIYKMPSLGADMESGVLAEWKVKEGDKVKKDDVIADIETSKGVIEAQVYADGTVAKIVGREGVEYPVGTPLAVIRTPDESEEEFQKELQIVAAAQGTETESEGQAPEETKEREAAPAEEKKPPQTEAPAPSIMSDIFGTTSEEPQAVEKPEETPLKTPGGHLKVTPLARKRARELGVDLEALAAKIKGKISLKDVEAAAKEAKAGKSVAGAIKPDAMRMAIAAAMSRSNAEIPHYYLSTPINMTPALDWLRKINAERSIKDRILPAAMMIRAVVLALRETPELNGFWKEGPVRSEEIHPGIAIARREGGLITPALIDAHEKSLDETMKALSDLIERTRGGKLTSSQMTKQTITITNLGDLGVEEVFGVIYPPQVAIVGFGRIMEKPWAEGDAIAIRKVVQATIAGDHRATDGRTGGLFLAKLDKILQNPEELL